MVDVELALGELPAPLVLDAPPDADPDADPVVGVNGAVTPKPGSSAFGTAAAKSANVLPGVVGGLIAPYIPPLQ